MVLLLLLIAGAGAGALYLRGETERVHADGQALVSASEDRLSRAKAELEAVDPSSVEGEERQLASERAIVSEALAKAQDLEAENDILDGDILQAQAELDAAREQGDTDYYLSVYESLHKGMEMVEGYLEGN